MNPFSQQSDTIAREGVTDSPARVGRGDCADAAGGAITPLVTSQNSTGSHLPPRILTYWQQRTRLHRRTSSFWRAAMQKGGPDAQA